MKNKRGEGPLKQEMRTMRIVQNKLETDLPQASHLLKAKNHIICLKLK